METIGIADLKAHLSSELKKVEAGETLVVLDHRRPVAWLVSVPEALPLARRRSAEYRCPRLEPLVRRDPLEALEKERADRW
jgi:antitoxin (DNA-binding transcriptional repressor) of toxin-antitoxin stability system